MNKNGDTLLTRARHQFELASGIYQYLVNDELYFNDVAYHLQQAVEMAMKYSLEMNGVEYPKTHDIDQLISIANRNNVTIPLTDYIDDHAGTLSVWEARTRYVMDLRVEKRKIEKALPEIDKYLSECEKEFVD